MTIETPTVLKKILTRKSEEISDRKSKVSVEQLKAQLDKCRAAWFCQGAAG